MIKEIVADVDRDQIRVGLLEDRRLVEFYVERYYDERVVGNIYKGKVANVLPGMQAAFVDIGLEKNAFLYVGDLSPHLMGLGEDEPAEGIKKPSIKDVLKVGQKVLVQVVKEPTGNKGPRVSTNITLPGRYFVLMPTMDYIGISRRIEEEEERDRLKDIAQKIRFSKVGIIVRTVAEHMKKEDLRSDMKMLRRLWKGILQKQKGGKAPRLIYRDMDLLSRMVRDWLTTEVSGFYINDRYHYKRILEMVSLVSPPLKDRVSFYSGAEDIFDRFDIEDEVDKALERKVWLKSGGYIVIDRTEALTVVDVNTGKFVGSIDLEDTVVKTNLEATSEIARQLRLRDIGGIIIVDLIDMDTQEHQKMVLDSLEEELKKDRTHANILGLTSLGLVEITRKKARQSIDEVLEKVCPYCDGKGSILSEETMAKKVEKKISDVFREQKGEAVILEVHPTVAAMVIGSGGNRLAQLEQKHKKQIYIRGKDCLHPEEIHVKAVGSKAELEYHALPVREGQIIEISIDEVHATNPKDGIARVDGYVIDVENASHLQGKRAKVVVGKAFRTYAKAKLLGIPSGKTH